MVDIEKGLKKYIKNSRLKSEMSADTQGMLFGLRDTTEDGTYTIVTYRVSGQEKNFYFTIVLSDGEVHLNRKTEDVEDAIRSHTSSLAYLNDKSPFKLSLKLGDLRSYL